MTPEGYLPLPPSPPSVPSLPPVFDHGGNDDDDPPQAPAPRSPSPSPPPSRSPSPPPVQPPVLPPAPPPRLPPPAPKPSVPTRTLAPPPARPHTRSQGKAPALLAPDQSIGLRRSSRVSKPRTEWWKVASKVPPAKVWSDDEDASPGPSNAPANIAEPEVWTDDEKDVKVEDPEVTPPAQESDDELDTIPRDQQAHSAIGSEPRTFKAAMSSAQSDSWRDAATAEYTCWNGPMLCMACMRPILRILIYYICKKSLQTITYVLNPVIFKIFHASVI